eukprot:CAMPEP_0174722408 /NCGR_PEP_ID=MMETSP1094-20130205/38382_1 /TAXON_ID=156173 /ORGANISM="Chrysochromulina brevifilum, Strain UTEX LB 985" /LENGTH=119 /DNA_ID=CAMNT_0015923259 /DNA_START=60 /DNA_END=419 /DNA_ORIENTATION=+
MALYGRTQVFMRACGMPAHAGDPARLLGACARGPRARTFTHVHHAIQVARGMSTSTSMTTHFWCSGCAQHYARTSPSPSHRTPIASAVGACPEYPLGASVAPMPICTSIPTLASMPTGC